MHVSVYARDCASVCSCLCSFFFFFYVNIFTATFECTDAFFFFLHSQPSLPQVEPLASGSLSWTLADSGGEYSSTGAHLIPRSLFSKDQPLKIYGNALADFIEKNMTVLVESVENVFYNVHPIEGLATQLLIRLKPEESETGDMYRVSMEHALDGGSVSFHHVHSETSHPPINVIVPMSAVHQSFFQPFMQVNVLYRCFCKNRFSFLVFASVKREI